MVDMGIAQTPTTQEYTHVYHMWERIEYNKRKWAHFNARFQEVYLDRQELEQTAGETVYASTNNVKQGDMEDTFMNFELET